MQASLCSIRAYISPLTIHTGSLHLNCSTNHASAFSSARFRVRFSAYEHNTSNCTTLCALCPASVPLRQTASPSLIQFNNRTRSKLCIVVDFGGRMCNVILSLLNMKNSLGPYIIIELFVYVTRHQCSDNNVSWNTDTII